MAIQKIGPQHGIEAARERENQLHPAYAAAWDKRSATFQSLVNNTNALIDEIEAVRLEVRRRPFG